MKTIVVGVDGSPQSVPALQWAVEQARTTKATLAVVHVYDPPVDTTVSAVGSALAFSPTFAGSEHDREPSSEARERANSIEREVRERAEQDISRMLGKVDASGVAVERLAVADHRPARVLIEQTRGADLLVVGSRGRGGFRGLLLGSVSQQVSTHSACPTVIVPSDRRGHESGQARH